MYIYIYIYTHEHVSMGACSIQDALDVLKKEDTPNPPTKSSLLRALESRSLKRSAWKCII